jgi:hypothetical protein
MGDVRDMEATEEAMQEAKRDLAYRDFCANFLHVERHSSSSKSTHDGILVYVPPADNTKISVAWAIPGENQHLTLGSTPSLNEYKVHRYVKNGSAITRNKPVTTHSNSVIIENMTQRLQKERFRASAKRGDAHQKNNQDKNRNVNNDIQKISSKQQDIYFGYAAPKNRYTELLQQEMNVKNRHVNNSNSVNNINNGPFFSKANPAAVLTSTHIGYDNNGSHNNNAGYTSFIDNKSNLRQTKSSKRGQFKYSFGKFHQNSILNPNQKYNFDSNSKGGKKRNILNSIKFNKNNMNNLRMNAAGSSTYSNEKFNRKTGRTNFLDSDSDSPSLSSFSSSSSSSSDSSPSDLDSDNEYETAKSSRLHTASKEGRGRKKKKRGGRKYKQRHELRSPTPASRSHSPSRNTKKNILQQKMQNKGRKKARGYTDILRDRGGGPIVAQRDHDDDEKDGGIYMYKQCALMNEDDGDIRIVSIYDGLTTYYLNEWKTIDPERENHKGFYVYSKKEEALRAVFPRNSRLKENPRVLLKVFVPHDSIDHIDRDIYVCARLKPKKMWDICLDDVDDQKQFGRGIHGGIFSKCRNNRYDTFGPTNSSVKKWKIVEWNHSGIWK